MSLELADYERKAREATMAFWGNREKARQKQIEAGKADQGERAGVTAGKNMDGFLALVIDLVKANGLHNAVIHERRAVLTLPGYFVQPNCGIFSSPKEIVWWRLSNSKARSDRHSATTSTTEQKKRSALRTICGPLIVKTRSANILARS